MPKIKIAYDKAPLKKGDKGPFIYHGQLYASYDDLVKAVGTDKLSYVGYRYEDVSEDDPRYLELNKVVLEPVEVIGNRTSKPGMVVPTASAEDLKLEAITDFDNIVFTGGELQGREVPTEFSSDGKTSFERALSGKRDPRGAKEYRANLEAIGMNPIFGNTRVQNSHNAWAKNPLFMLGWTNALTLSSTTLLSPFAIPTAVEAAPAVSNWLMNTGMPWVAKYIAAPTAAGMTWDLTLKALTGTTTTEQISNYLQLKGWNPVISEMVGGISNPGYWINFGGVGKYTRPLFNKIGLGLSNPSAPIELSPTILANINASMPKSKFLTKVVEPVTNFYNTTRNAMIPAIIGTRMRIMPLGKIQTTLIPLNVGWGPRLTVSVTHKSDQAFPLSLYNEQRWDVLNEGANPFGIWFQGKLGIPRTTNTGATLIKAEKALKARQLFSRRPYTHSGDLTLDKPLVTIGDVPNRSALSYLAEQMGADGLIYNNVYDNGYDANLVLLSFKLPDASKKLFFQLGYTAARNAVRPIIVGRKIRTTPLGEVPTLTPSIESYNVNLYLTNGLWNLPKIKEDMLAGKLDFIEWIESPEYRIAAEANKKEAEAMGLKYVPTYEYPAYSDIKSKGAPVTFTILPENNAMGWVATNLNSPITINLAKAKNIRSVMAHETAHKARHGWVDPNYSNFDIKKLLAYLRYKNSQVFLDDRADLTKEAGNMFYDFSSTGFPHEAVTNSRDLGKYYGIKVGQEYPGPEKTLELLNKMEREANTGFLKKFVLAFRKDPEHLKYVWKALNGTQWAITPLALGVTALNFNKTQEDEKD